MENRLMKIEMNLANMERAVEDLNEVVIAQGREIGFLKKQNQMLIEGLSQPSIKLQNDEAPPPHY